MDLIDSQLLYVYYLYYILLFILLLLFTFDFYFLLYRDLDLKADCISINEEKKIKDKNIYKNKKINKKKEKK